ncbi:MAG: hypothetical protein JJ974_11740 [Phycisphaerales bacterium]|nr:hypothetical protein [Phycisphaerales bacterium]
MIHPAPTTKIDPTLTRTVIDSIIEATHAKPAMVVLSYPNTNYKTHLVVEGDLEDLHTKIGKTVLGTIHATSRRIDPAGAGGRCIDPCMGTPRRVMGTIVGIDPRSNGMVINVGPNIAVWLTLGAPGQKAIDLAGADFVTCDVFPGASFRFKELA